MDEAERDQFAETAVRAIERDRLDQVAERAVTVALRDQQAACPQSGRRAARPRRARPTVASSVASRESALVLWERTRVRAGYAPGSGTAQLQAEADAMRAQGASIPSNHLTPFGW